MSTTSTTSARNQRQDELAAAFQILQPHYQHRIQGAVSAKERAGVYGLICAIVMVIAITFSVLAFPMLRRHAELQKYSETNCTAATNVYWKQTSGSPSGRATTTVVATGQNVVLRFPGYPPPLAVYTTSDLTRWLKTIQQPTFLCYVEKTNGTAEGVTNTYLHGLNGWRILATLGAVVLVIAVVLLAFVSLNMCIYCRVYCSLAGSYTVLSSHKIELARQQRIQQQHIQQQRIQQQRLQQQRLQQQHHRLPIERKAEA